MAAARSQSEREETFEVGLKAITEICPIARLPSFDYGSTPSCTLFETRGERERVGVLHLVLKSSLCKY